MDHQTVVEIHELHARLCKAIADPKRLLIISELRDGPMSVGQLAEALQISQSNCSQHLAILRDRGILESTRMGAHVEYALRSDKVLAAIDLLREFMAEELDSQGRMGAIAGRSSA